MHYNVKRICNDKKGKRKMIKVLHFVSKMDRAGQETFIMNVYRVADRGKIQFNFLCTVAGEGDYDNEIYSLGGQIYHIERIEKPTKNKIEKYLQMIATLAEWLKTNRDKYDIVHIHTYHALDVLVHLEACKRAGVKRIFIHSHNSEGLHKRLHKIARIFFRFYNFEKLACSESAAYWMYGNKAVKNKETTVIYNGIDIEKFKYNKEQAKALKVKMGFEGKTVLGHIGRFNYQKNHKFLIDILYEYLKINENAVLVLVGRGELKNDIERYAEQLGIIKNICFLGVRDDIHKLLNVFDIFIFPSLFEGLSVVFWEAQCNGLTILATDNISDEAITSKGVHLLPLSNAKMWAEKIEKYKGERTKDIDYKKMDSTITSKCLLKKYEEVISNDKIFK